MRRAGTLLLVNGTLLIARRVSSARYLRALDPADLIRVKQARERLIDEILRESGYPS